MRGRAWLALAGLLLGMGGGASGQEVAGPQGAGLQPPRLVLRGTFHDARQGQVLVDGWNLLLPEEAIVRLNGSPARPDELPRGQAAVVVWEARSGRVARLEVVAPGLPQPPSAGAEEGPRVGLRAVRIELAGEGLPPGRPLLPGDRLRVEALGPSGGEVTVDVLGRAEGIRLAEGRPGVYRGLWVVPPGPALRETFTLARFRRGGVVHPPRVGPRLCLAGPAAPLAAWGPVGRAWPDAPVHAVFSGEGLGVDPARVGLEVDGRRVTALATVQGGGVYYRPPQGFAPGLHHVRLWSHPPGGGGFERRWTFEVSAPQGWAGARGAP